MPAVVAVNNSGAISVAASADAAGSTANPVEFGTLSGPFDAGSGVANAMGIYMDLAAGPSAGPNRGTLTNSGSIMSWRMRLANRSLPLSEPESRLPPSPSVKAPHSPLGSGCLAASTP